MTTPRRSFRFTCAPSEIPVVEEMLRLQGYGFEEDPFFLPARRAFSEPRPLGSSLAAFFGLIYIQDRASMLPPLALDPPRGASVLDMCSSPGSKTSQLAWLTGPSGFVLGNEPSPVRLANLRRNLHTMGLMQTATCCQSGEKLPLPDAGWDLIQLDPPCSGWGTVEKNPRVLDIWKDGKVAPLIRLQRDLLREACRLLRPGGVVVYSTCTTDVEENERQVLFARDELGLVPEPLGDVPGFDLQAPQGCEGVWCLNPKAGDTQGFFVARLRKPGTPSGPAPYTEDPVQAPVVSEGRLRELGLDPAQVPTEIGIFGESLHALPIQALAALPSALHWQGLYMGKAGRNGELRISPRCRIGGGPVLDLEGAEGLRSIAGLLQGQSLSAPGGLEAGCRSVLMRWNGTALGRLTVKGKRLVWSER
ncbi:MAG: RsmB/NOP family class I SAM-dependent RNA methyltransferase [Mailhella sp.]|nr:RsmB/NOP family class I SAM-dependent RNA methyltransferase [Mailhella sp.]